MILKKNYLTIMLCLFLSLACSGQKKAVKRVVKEVGLSNVLSREHIHSAPYLADRRDLPQEFSTRFREEERIILHCFTLMENVTVDSLTRTNRRAEIPCKEESDDLRIRYSDSVGSIYEGLNRPITLQNWEDQAFRNVRFIILNSFLSQLYSFMNLRDSLMCGTLEGQYCDNYHRMRGRYAEALTSLDFSHKINDLIRWTRQAADLYDSALPTQRGRNSPHALLRWLLQLRIDAISNYYMAPDYPIEPTKKGISAPAYASIPSFFPQVNIHTYSTAQESDLDNFYSSAIETLLQVRNALSNFKKDPNGERANSLVSFFNLDRRTGFLPYGEQLKERTTQFFTLRNIIHQTAMAAKGASTGIKSQMGRRPQRTAKNEQLAQARINFQALEYLGLKLNDAVISVVNCKLKQMLHSTLLENALTSTAISRKYGNSERKQNAFREELYKDLRFDFFELLSTLQQHLGVRHQELYLEFQNLVEIVVILNQSEYFNSRLMADLEDRGFDQSMIFGLPAEYRNKINSRLLSPAPNAACRAN